MAFASDKLYQGYLRVRMPSIVSRVKVREIIPHLPCLTDHDRETIEAKRETCGNFDSMVLLLDCLKRRDNWPEQFIAALEACGHLTLADEIRREYDALRGDNNSSPRTPSATVTRAHVHPAPSANPLSIPETGGNSQATVSPPAPSAPPEPVVQASSPPEIRVQPQAPQSPDPEPPQPAQTQVAPALSTPPPSPESHHTEAFTHQEPVENSESDIQEISADKVNVPDQVRAGNSEVESVEAPQPPAPVQQCETDSPSKPEALQATTVTSEGRPPQSPAPAQRHSEVRDGSTLLMTTPEKPPVQDTTPPVDVKPAPVLEPEETSEPPVTQIVGSSQQPEAAATTSALPDAAEANTSLSDTTLCLSKPAELISFQPQNNGSPVLPAPDSPVQPYSGNSDRLEISSVAVASDHVSTCAAVSSDTVNTASAPECQDNGVVLNHNEPEENHYESETVLVNVVQISQEPSILNLDGQSSAPQAQMVNGEPLSASAADTVSNLNAPPTENHLPCEPPAAETSAQLKTLQRSEKKTSSDILTTNTKYVLTAAGVGACALLMAWKFKN